MMTRRDQLRDALAIMAPMIPKYDKLEVVDLALASPGLAKGSPQAAIWGALTSHIRHVYTDYDDLLDQGLTEAEARQLTLDAINDVLTQWGSKPIRQP